MSLKEENATLKEKITTLEAKVARQLETVIRFNTDNAYLREELDNDITQKNIRYSRNLNKRLNDRIYELKRAIGNDSYSGMYHEVSKINKELEKQIADMIVLEHDKKEFEKSVQENAKKIEEKAKDLETENIELKKKLSEFEKDIEKEKEEFEKERNTFALKEKCLYKSFQIFQRNLLKRRKMLS